MATLVSASTTEQDLLGGLLWTVGYTSASIAGGGGTEQLGILIGDKDVIYQTRTYGGTVTQLKVALFQDTWSGGTPVAGINRNLKIALPGPATYASGVTGTPTTLRTSLTLYSSGVGSSSVGVIPEGEWYMLQANTRYILVLTNEGAPAGIANFRWTYRAVD